MHINMKQFASAIEEARKAVIKTRSQDVAIPVILAAIGMQPKGNPWVPAVEALKEYTKRTRIPYDLFHQRQLLIELEGRIDALREQLQVKFDRDLNAQLIKTYGNLKRATERFNQLKEEAGITRKLSEIEAEVDKLGLMDMLGLKASDLTAAKREDKRVAYAAKHPQVKATSTTDIVIQYHLSAADLRLADLIAYLRNLMRPEAFKVKRHSKPRKRQSVDEGTLKEQIALARPSVIKEYATGKIVVLK